MACDNEYLDDSTSSSRYVGQKDFLLVSPPAYVIITFADISTQAALKVDRRIAQKDLRDLVYASGKKRTCTVALHVTVLQVRP